jgi:BMFP domain-containing protein YqiC
MFDDLARVTNGAASVLSGFRDEAEAKLRQRLERLLADMDVVPREEFEAVREMASNARREQEALAKRVAALENIVEGLAAVGKARRASRRTGKDAAEPADGEPSEPSD